MKKILITSLLSVGALGAYAQGTLNFTDYDYGTISTHIWSPSPTSLSTTQVHGNTSTDFPAGSTVYTGAVKLGGSSANTGANGIFGNGNNFTVQLEALGGATTSVALSSLLPVTQYTSHINTTPSGAGQWTPPTISGADPGIPGAGGTAPTADFAVAAWYNGGGTGDATLAAAQADKNGIWGESSEVVNFALTPPASITGKPQGFNSDETAGSFSLQANTPEPSSIALGVMAAGAFLARRRKS
jgi:hypothetical protein